VCALWHLKEPRPLGRQILLDPPFRLRMKNSFCDHHELKRSWILVLVQYYH